MARKAIPGTFEVFYTKKSDMGVFYDGKQESLYLGDRIMEIADKVYINVKDLQKLFDGLNSETIKMDRKKFDMIMKKPQDLSKAITYAARTDQALIENN